MQEVGEMPLFLGQFTYHRKTWKALAAKPENRAEAVTAATQQLGVRLVDFYHSHGKYDGLVIFEAPDDTTAKAVAIAAIGAGHLKDLEITRLLTGDEALAAMRAAGGMRLPVPALGD
jgi:uncharacterized protein with GYD domain